MSKFKFYKISVVVLALAFTIALSGLTIVKAIGTTINLGTAGDFAVLAGAAVSDSNPAVGIDIIGNVGLSPTGGTAITGLSCSQVTGTIYDTNAGYTGGFDSNVGCRTMAPALLTTAKADLSLGYNDARTQPIDNAVVASATDSFAAFGYVLAPGVYNSGSSMGVPIALELDGGGNPNAVFIFQAGSTLNTVTSSIITLTDGAQACNVFWQVGSSAILGTGSNFKGTIMAAVSITDASGSTVLGRLLADANNLDADSTGAVTLNNTHVTVPTCASPNITLIKTVTTDNGGTALASAWTLEAAGPTPISGVTGSGAVTNAVVTAGTYTLSETGGPTGYTGSTYSCVKNGGEAVVSNSIILSNSDDATCTITNNDNVPSLTLNKIVVNDNGSTALESDWTLTATGPTGFGGVGPTVNNGASFDAGTYDLSEAGPAGYTSSDWVCIGGTQVDGDTISLALGDSATCTITNNDIATSSSSGSSRSTSIITPIVTPEIQNPISLPTESGLVLASTPGLPKTGFPPEGESSTLPIVILVGISMVSIFLYFARKKQTT